jgi:hypothetical protein
MTLLFATMYIGSEAEIPRYRKYLDYYIPRLEMLGASNLVLMDDGSNRGYLEMLGFPIFQADQLPEDMFMRDALLNHEPQTTNHVSIITFPDHLGRKELFDFPGWWRSFLFSFRELNGFDKIIHIESDAYIYSGRLFEYIRGLSDGWSVLWCPRHKFPETQIQVICDGQINKIKGFAPYEIRHFQADPERNLPFTHIEKSFKGDRYFEYPQEIPKDADYSCQTTEIPSKF